jgi:hypothetical protein
MRLCSRVEWFEVLFRILCPIIGTSCVALALSRLTGPISGTSTRNSEGPLRVAFGRSNIEMPDPQGLEVGPSTRQDEVRVEGLEGQPRVRARSSRACMFAAHPIKRSNYLRVGLSQPKTN